MLRYNWPPRSRTRSASRSSSSNLKGIELTGFYGWEYGGDSTTCRGIELTELPCKSENPAYIASGRESEVHFPFADLIRRQYRTMWNWLARVLSFHSGKAGRSAKALRASFFEKHLRACGSNERWPANRRFPPYHLRITSRTFYSRSAKYSEVFFILSK